jgi:hypothetical protein
VTGELRESHLSGSQALLDVLGQQKKIQFRNIITGDESWIFIRTVPGSIWLSLDEELPTRPWPTIGTDKRMLVVFSGMTRIVHVSLPPKDAQSTQPTSVTRC